MNISELSIRRPVLSTVLTIIILLFGMIGYTYLGVREYPSVDNPIISVQCSYTGANADVIENQITEPLEQNINGIPGIRSLTSVSQQGQSRITVEFELSVDLETAANDVRDKVSRAQRYLPDDCDPPTVSKADADATPILMVALQSNKRSLLELSEIADLTVKEQLQTISDVSSVSIWGEKKYSMRLWLDPTKMSGFGITPVDVKEAIDRENIELPSGSIEGNTTELTIRTLGLMHTPEEFNNLIIREDGNRIIRFSDIGRAELGAADIKSYMKMNGVPMVGVVVIPQPGANHIEIADAVYERMERMKKDLPDDVDYTYGFDNTRFIRASINEVEHTVYEAFVLVIIIIFLFLRDWRVTLVPCIVIPVSLIGAFFVMYVAGFSINVLTMLAVVLAVGLVVDDAIVMTENIYVRIEQGMEPLQAGIEGAEHWVDARELKTDQDIAKAVRQYTVFGRVVPNQKRKIVRALQSQGRTVAMTGDGVNDVLALKDADCGVAMASGADAACQVAQLVLLDSDFAAMPKVVAEGRRVINNIQRASALYLVKNILSFFLAIITLFAAFPYPFVPIQLTLISTLTIGVPSFFLALEPNHDLVRGKFLHNVFRRAFPGGLTAIFVILFAELFVYTFGLTLDELSTICVVLMAINGLMVIYYAARPLDWKRTALLVLMGVGMFVAVVFYGGVFSMSSLSFAAWLVLVALALLVVPIQMALEKLFDRCAAVLARRAERKARKRAARAARSRR